MSTNLKQVAVIGGGLVGSGWAVVFARAGIPVRLFDASEDIRQGASSRIRGSLSDMQEFGLVSDVDAIAQRIEVVDSLVDAVSGADYVQESVFERVDVKKAVSAEIGAAIR
ncbi:3-hydroxyacyl-CoA dehydrogenase, partial [Mesorhizobium sp. M7A.F.Ca.US.014.04.1.1]